jgi:hypothetical protein
MKIKYIDTEFQDDNLIDPNQLDVESIEYAEIFWKWSNRLEHAKKQVDDCKFRLSVAKANMQNLCRSHPEKFGISKITEAAVEGAVEASDTYREHYQELIDARHVAGLLEKAVESLRLKGRRLDNLVTLFGLKYFAGPRVPRNLADLWDAHKTRKSNLGEDRQKQRTRKPKKKKKRKKGGHDE